MHSVPATISRGACCPNGGLVPILRPRDYEGWLWPDETTDARRRRMARTIMSPATASAMLPTYTRAGFDEREAPPNPVCGAPVGMTDATVPVAPPAPLPVPVEPPAPTAPPLPPASPPARGGPTGTGCGRRRGGRSRNEHIGDRGHARHGTATTVRSAIALVDGHWKRRIRARYGATRGRLSCVGAPAVRRAVALRDSRICGAAKGCARLRARGGRSDALIHRGT